MKVLIIGGNGQLGKSLCNTKPENLDLISYSKEEFNLLDIDDCVKKTEKLNPNYVIIVSSCKSYTIIMFYIIVSIILYTNYIIIVFLYNKYILV